MIDKQGKRPFRDDAFGLQSAETFAEIVRDLKLRPSQARELRITLSNVDQDLKNHRKRLEGRQPRAELVRRLRRIAKCLADLEFEIDRWRNTMTDFLPFDALEETGLLMSYSAMEAALSRNIRSHGLTSEVERLAADHPDFRIAQIEDRFTYQRRAIGLKNGPTLLAAMIKRINQPIKTWLELDRLNQGGRPSNLVRDYLLIRLAEAAPTILGRSPTATAGGRFVWLCVSVFAACGLDDGGIERAVERALKIVKTRSRPAGAGKIARPGPKSASP